MPLDVIGSGFGRTGTASLRAALNMLGFGPCHHMEEVLHDPSQVPHWQAVAARQKVEWEDVFKGYRSQVDWPGAHVWRELAAAYPQAKVVHSVRNEDSWWKSFSATIGTVMAQYQQMPAPPHVKAMMDAMSEVISKQTFGCPPGDRDGVLAAFRRRTEEVRAALPAGRLLIYDVAEGWGPLCRFLGVPEPAEPFPRMNSTEEFWQTLRGEKKA